MIELLFIPLDLLQASIQNFTIIATLVLLYYFIPDSIRARSKLINSLCVGIIFGLAAVISIPALWQTTGSPVIGYNIILVPLAGFIGGPVSTVFVAAVLLLGSAASGGMLSPTDILTVMGGILLGALFYSGRSWTRFPRSSLIQLALLGTGVMFIELCSFVLPFIVQDVNRQQSSAPPLLSVFPYLLIIFGGTIILGSIIGFIDRKKLAEKELLDYKNHLEDLVQERTAELRQANSLLEATIESTADGIVVIDPNCFRQLKNDPERQSEIDPPLLTQKAVDQINLTQPIVS